MKKRGQKPNSQTFTILLRGLADHAGNPTTLGTALSIYHSISAPNSNVNRNIIHTNALLKICSRQLDLDSMWDIVSKLPDNGSYAASNWTFTTILQTMREKALKDSNGTGDSNAAAARREETIVEGRKLWAVIIGRWRKGDIVVDEKLVCAMGRLLTIGSRPRDWDDVLSLVQQTMAIPRAVPRLGTEAREQGGQPRVRAPNSGADVKNDNSEIVVEHDEARPGSEFGDSFGYEASTQARGRTSAPSNYAKPGNNTLSLLMDACLKTAQKGPALHYWRLLTQPGGVHVVRPDTDNIHMLLRILRFKRASSEAMKILQHDMRELRLPYTAKTLRLAMSACVRDVLSPNVMENANRLLDLMSENFDKPDLNVLAQYTEVAAKSAEHLATVHASHANIGKTNANEPRADIKLLVSAVNRLKGGEWRPSLLSDTIKSVRDELGLAIPRPGTGPSPDPRSLEFAESDELGDAPAATAKPREKVAAFVAQRELLSTLLRNVVGLYDKILNAVAEERAKLSKTSSDAPYAIFGITPAAEKGFVDAKKSMAKQLTRLNNRGQEVKRQEVQRGARQGRMDRRVVEENQEEGEEGEEGESEEEIDMGGRKWMPGVRPRSGIQKSMARQKAVVEPTIEEDVGEEEAVEELDMGDRKWLPSSSIDRSVAGQRSGHRANAGSRR
jgi:flagellin-like hook-associated protein FlgL